MMDIFFSTRGIGISGRKKGFTLLEVLISAILVTVGIGAMGVTVVAGKNFLKAAEERAQAMRLATNKMDEYLAKTYDGLAGIGSTNSTEGKFEWEVKVNNKSASAAKTIPYKEIEVVVSYPQENGQGTTDARNIRLTNVVPYPRVHSRQVTLGEDSDPNVPFNCDKSGDPNNTTCGNFNITDVELVGSATGGYLTLGGNDTSFEVTKDIQVAYGISIGVESTKPDQIKNLDTIYSVIYSDGLPLSTAITTRTPIKTQSSFSNMAVIEDVPPANNHTIEVKWSYDRPTKGSDGNFIHTFGYSQTRITLKKAQMSIIATESE